jgi:hypothetical protein
MPIFRPQAVLAAVLSDLAGWIGLKNPDDLSPELPGNSPGLKSGGADEAPPPWMA